MIQKFFIVFLVALSLPAKITAIYGGSPASRNQRPYMAIFLDDQQLVPRGGGAIISERYILTVASVLNPEEVRWVSVGGTVIQEGLVDGTTSLISEKIYHPSYLTRYRSNFGDYVAIAQISVYLQFGDNIKPISIATSGVRVDVGTAVVSCGWGYTEAIRTSNQLVCGQFLVISREDCENEFEDRGMRKNFVSTSLCANGATGEKERWCSYDVGGPIISGDFLVGLTFTVTECHIDFVPNQAINIAPFAGWIDTYTRF